MDMIWQQDNIYSSPEMIKKEIKIREDLDCSCDIDQNMVLISHLILTSMGPIEYIKKSIDSFEKYRPSNFSSYTAILSKDVELR